MDRQVQPSAAGDVELFDRIADGYARKDLAPSARTARRRRLLRTLAAATLPAQPRVLEIGCGAGFAARHLAGRYAQYVGLDPASKLIEHARRLHPLPGVEFVAADARTFEPAGGFDLVFAIGVLHHLDDLPSLMHRLASWLEPGGWLAVNEPHSGNPLVSLARRARKRLDASYSTEQAELSARELQELFAGAGLANVSVRAQGFFSTPFAEVVLRPNVVFAPLAGLACLADAALESLGARWLTPLSWNVVAAGRRPPERAH